jgi:conjugative transfer signal peptidase TraF
MRATLIAGALALAGLLAPSAVPAPPVLVWNASASAPIGLYLVRPMRRPVRGVLAVIRLPEANARFAAERGYLPLGAPLIKPVAAVAGQVVCQTRAGVAIDGRPIGQALKADRRGRRLFAWSGCRVVFADEVFVMNPAVRDSFDGRYFGPLPTTAVLGRARPLFIPSCPAQPQRSLSHAPDR